MVSVYSDADFIRNFDAIADRCCQSGEPVVILRDGRDALVLVRFDDYAELLEKLEVYDTLAESRAEAMADIRKKIIDNI